MGLESSTSEGLSSVASNVVSGTKDDVKRGGSLDSSRVVDGVEKPGEVVKGNAEADQADAIRNGSLDNARAD